MAQDVVHTWNILPNRLPFFNKRMAEIKYAADEADPPIKFDLKYADKIYIPLAKYLILRAERNELADTFKDPKTGEWKREVIPVTLTRGDLTQTGFDYIGFIDYADYFKDGVQYAKPFPHVVRMFGDTDEEHELRVKRITPQLMDIADKFTDHQSLNCDHCNPEGDNQSRHRVYIVQSTKDQVRSSGKKDPKTRKFIKMQLKTGEILQLGTFCMKKYTGIDPTKLAAFYELDRAVCDSRGPNASPNNPAGWGYNEMGIHDYADRLVQYYGMREQEWLSQRRKFLYQVESAETIYSKATISSLVPFARGNNMPKDGEGCFVERAKEQLFRGRMFDLNADQPTLDAKWMIQPYKNQGGVMSMVLSSTEQAELGDAYKKGVSESVQIQQVMVINEADGTPIIDPITNDIMMEDIEVPSAEYIRNKLTSHRYGKRGEWELKIVPILPPAIDSKLVEDTRNRMLEWIANADPNQFMGGRFGDEMIRIKSMCELGAVGNKTYRDAPLLWKYFMIADFDRRKKAAYKARMKEVKARCEVALTDLGYDTENMKWYKIENDNDGEFRKYVREIYPNVSVGYSRRSHSAALPKEFAITMMTPAQYNAYPKWRDDRVAAELHQQETWRKDRAYRDEVRRIKRQGYGYGTTNAYNRKVNYEPSVDRFLTSLGWDLNDPSRFNMNGELFTLDTSGNIGQAHLNDEQLRIVNDEFRPQVISTPTHTPAVSTPTSNTYPKINFDEANSLKKSVVNKSKYDGFRGQHLDVVEGYMAWISNPKGFYRAGMPRNGRSIVIVNPVTDMAYTIFYFGEHLPTIGNYYRLMNVVVNSKTAYKGLESTIIEGENGGQVTFTDATS